MNNNATKRVTIIGGTHTPFAKAGTALKRHGALALAVHAVNGLLERERPKWTVASM
jgi:acetyl-CoA acetyltransferase